MDTDLIKKASKRPARRRFSDVPQIDVIRALAASFQDLHFPDDVPKTILPLARGFEPLIFRTERAGAFAPLLRRALDDLMRRSSSPRTNWRAVLINVKYNLVAQLSDVSKILTDEQARLAGETRLINPLRTRARRRNVNEFWLKHALCVLELHLNMAPINDGNTLSSERIARALYDPVHKLHIALKGSQNVEHGIPNPYKRDATEFTQHIRDALVRGKKLSECFYEFLIGLPIEEIAPPKDATSDE